MRKDGAKELRFKEGGLEYRDRYYGFDPFVGEEVVQKDGIIIWSMNYYGGSTRKEVPAKEVYAFLRKALRKITADKPFRGPKNFKEDSFEYRDESSGDVERFLGTEKILFKGEEVYRLDYHGGTVKEKLES